MKSHSSFPIRPTESSYPRDARSVSYTHLDVYKRQVSENSPKISAPDVQQGSLLARMELRDRILETTYRELSCLLYTSKAARSALTSAIDAYIKQQGKYNKNESGIKWQDVQDCLVPVSYTHLAELVAHMLR